MEEKQTQSEETLPNIQTVQEALLAITRTYQDAYHDPKSSKPVIPAIDSLLDRLSLRATQLGASQYEIARASLGGMSKGAQRVNFKSWEDQNIYGKHKSLTPQELLDLKEEFKL